MKIFDKQHDRILFYEEKTTVDYWDKHWNKYCAGNLKGTIERYENNWYILSLTKKYLNNATGRILEGGCGVGGFVYCLQKKGYNVYGVDFAEKTVKKIKEVFPDLNILIDDVRNFSFPDKYFSIYYSFGVIEHFIDGYEQIVMEAYRVLKPNGYLIVTFPKISILRRIKILLGAYSGKNLRKINGLEFYQFAFNPANVIKNLKSFGFKLISRKSADGLKGIKDEIFILKPILQILFDYRGRNLIIRAIRLIFNRIFSPLCGHMCQLVMQSSKK